MAADSEQVQDDDKRQCILCVMIQKGRLGVAAFDTLTSEIVVGEGTEGDDFTLLQLVKLELSPTMILISSKVNAAFVEECKKKFGDESFDVIVRPSTEFTEENGLHKLSLLKIKALTFRPAQDPTSPQYLQWLNSIVDLENRQMLRACGCLVGFMQQNELQFGLDVTETNLCVQNIRTIPLTGFLMVDSASLKALSIFRLEAHPSKQGIGKHKEGLSLFGIMNRTKSVPGKRLLRLWFLRPLYDARLLADRLNIIDYFMDSRNAACVRELRDCLGHLRDIRQLMGKFRLGAAQVADWSCFLQSTLHFRRMMDVAEKFQEQSMWGELQLQSVSEEALAYVITLVNDVIDFEESKALGQMCIRPGVSSRLDALRAQWENLPQILTPIAREILSTTPSDLVECLSVVFQKQIGFLVSIPTTGTNCTEPINIPGLQFQYATDEARFFKNERVRQLDEELGDLSSRLLDEENHLLRELSEKILTFHDVLILALNVGAELDCLLSFAVASVEMKFHRPTFSEDNVLHIVQGRHALQELHSGGGGPMNIITGPNFSGKSVYLKQVGLIVFLAHLGCPVPAESAEIGLVDRIFTRIQSQESVTLQQSTFFIDSCQVSMMLRHSTPRSLLLLDEWGKGTAPQDGIVLWAATVNSLVRRGQNCPKTFVSTHFLEVFSQGLLLESPLMHYYTMDVVSEQTPASNNAPPVLCDSVSKKPPAAALDEVVYLYRLVVGRATSSFGFACARAAGIPDDVLRRAIEVAPMLAAGRRVPPLPQSRAEEAMVEAVVERFGKFNVERDDPLVLMSDVRAILARFGKKTN